MRLLFDANLSRHLVARLSDLWPGSSHVGVEGSDTDTDRAVWSLARARGFTLVTKDRDFRDPTRYPGPPPQVIELAMGNASTTEIEAFFRANREAIEAFERDGLRFLVLMP